MLLAHLKEVVRKAKSFCAQDLEVTISSRQRCMYESLQEPKKNVSFKHRPKTQPLLRAEKTRQDKPQQLQQPKPLDLLKYPANE